MRRWLFLRSAHKGNRDTPPPDPILDVDEDMWCSLFARIVALDNARGQIWKVGSAWSSVYSDHLAVIRGPDITWGARFRPDVIFDRGGYPDYVRLLDACPQALTVYYGAGERWCPARRYDVVLTDMPAQRTEVLARYPSSRVIVFHKPASPVFEPAMCKKTFDVVFVAGRPAAFKGFNWLIERLPEDARVLRIGPVDPWFSRAPFPVAFAGVLQRREIPGWACRAKVGVVCDDGRYDSGPRILPELLAMNIPVLVRPTVRADLAAYVTPQTGRVVEDADVDYQWLQEHWSEMTPRRVYDERFSVDRAAQSILCAVGEER